MDEQSTPGLRAAHARHSATLAAMRALGAARDRAAERAAYELRDIESELARRGAPPDNRWYSPTDLIGDTT